MLLVYTHKETERVTYTFDLFFNNLLKVDYVLTQDLERYKSFTGTKLNYSFQPISENEVFIQSHGLLFKTGLADVEVKVTSGDEYKKLFPTSTSAIDFDLFAAAFYLVSRYEEYLPHKKDVYDRFAVEESLAYKHGFLQYPIVDYWAETLRGVLVNNGVEVGVNKYTFLSTIDVDNAFAYIGKGFVRTMGAVLRSVINRSFTDLGHRLKCLFLGKHDPYNTFQRMQDLHQEYGVKALYFFLVGDYDVNDKNVPITSRKFQAIIKGVGDYFDVGIHPSYASNTNPEKIKIETKRLTNVLHKDIYKSRQHFLKLRFPTTYTDLIDAGIRQDYTMGYAAECGFRAGIARPFRFYNLDVEKSTRLEVYPFFLMEATLKYYKNQSAEQAMEVFKPIIDEVKKVNGTMISLWHSDSISGHHQWGGWQDLYEELLKEARDDKNIG